MNAPSPHFTSSTSALLPSASFLLMIDAEISGMLSTVAVTSRSAYSFLSAGASDGGLADDAVPTSRSACLNSSIVRSIAEAGNRFELVERAAGVAETAARHLRHDDAARRGDRREDDRDLVADAAGAVLADLDAGNVREVDALAGSHHRVGEPAGLLVGHAAQDDRHQQRRRLVVGDRRRRSRRRRTHRSRRARARARRACGR